MSVFILMIVAGLTGLTLMALPGLLHHGGHDTSGAEHAGHGVTHGGNHPLPAHEVAGHNVQGHGHDLPGHNGHGHTDGGEWGILRFIPSPRVVFSLMALIGAFGNLFEKMGHLPFFTAALAALIPAWLVERFCVRSLWNFLMGFAAKPDTPLTNLVLEEAEAITSFTHGRGMVQVVRDGRLVQFSAYLTEEQANFCVRTGDKLRIENVDAEHERLTVSVR